LPKLSVLVMVKVLMVWNCGVPLIVDPDRLRPCGSVPAVSAYVYGPVPPLLKEARRQRVRRRVV
jgi:hypothetical protein